VSRTLLNPPGASEGTEKLTTPVALPPEPRLRPSNPVVDLTGAFPVFTIVAVPTNRPRSSRTEIRRTDSGYGDAAGFARGPAAKAAATTSAPAVNANNKHTPTALMSTDRSRRGPCERAEPPRITTDRNVAIAFAPKANLYAPFPEASHGAIRCCESIRATDEQRRNSRATGARRRRPLIGASVASMPLVASGASPTREPGLTQIGAAVGCLRTG
jgi:hypothetical protein